MGTEINVSGGSGKTYTYAQRYGIYAQELCDGDADYCDYVSLCGVSL